ncbi:MAG TPA: hypothetical protein DIV79_15285 [Opitutae bacterium]|nr:hypothetical protein [Opitutae bacterium]
MYDSPTQLTAPISLIVTIDGDASSCAEGSKILERFLGSHAIDELNIVGPRASEAPKAYEYTYALFQESAKRAS